MAKRDRGHDRIKVTINWEEPSDSIVGKLAQEAILTRISEALPNKNVAGLQSDIRKDVTLTTLESGAKRHKHVYRFKYKRPYLNTRQCDMWHIWSFCIQLKKLEGYLDGELGLKVEIDAQASRLPWVFDNGDRVRKPDELRLAVRPGSMVYKVEDVAPIRVARSCASFAKLLGLLPDADRFGTDFMIVGEPRAAWKVYRYYQQLLRGGKLDPQHQESRVLRTALPDLVCVLYRNRQHDNKWRLVEPDGPKMHGQYQAHILTGDLPDNWVHGIPDFGLRYELLNVNQE